MFRLIDRPLRSTGRMPRITLRLLRFLRVRDAGRRGNKITVLFSRVDGFSLTGPGQQMRKPWKCLLIELKCKWFDYSMRIEE